MNKHILSITVLVMILFAGTAYGISMLGGEVSTPGFGIPDIEAVGGKVFVAYKDFGDYPPGQDYVIVKTYEGSAWVNVGTPRLIPQISALSLKKVRNLYLAYIGQNGSLYIQEIGATGDWTYFGATGGTVPPPIAQAEHICHLSAVPSATTGIKLAVAYKDKVTKRGFVAAYNTGSWSLLGGGPVTLTAINDIQIAHYNNTYYAAFTEKDSNISRLRIQRFTPGAGWSDVAAGTPFLAPTTNIFQFTADDSGKLWLSVYDSSEYKAAFYLDTTVTAPEWVSLCFESGIQTAGPNTYCKSNKEGHKFFKGEPDGRGNFYAMGQTNTKEIFMYEWSVLRQKWREITPAIAPLGYKYVATNTAFAVDRSTNRPYALFQEQGTNVMVVKQDP